MPPVAPPGVLETRCLLDAGPVYINELMAKNTKTYENNAGNYTDWLEVYNPTAAAVTLACNGRTKLLSDQ